MATLADELKNAMNPTQQAQKGSTVVRSRTTKALEAAGVRSVISYDTPQASRPVNKINVPEVIDPTATFTYNYFTRDERIRPDSVEIKKRIVSLDASNTDEIFHRIKNQKLARFVRIQFKPPKVPPELKDRFTLENKSFDLTDALNSIIVEGANSDDVFSGVEIIDTGKEDSLYKMMNGAMFFSDLREERESNREAISKLYDTLEEKGGLKGQDKKVLFDAFKNFTPNTSPGNNQYILAPSDVPPEVSKFANDPIGKQSISVQFNNLLMSDVIASATIIPDNVFQDELRSLIPVSKNFKTELLSNIPPVHTYRSIDYELQVKAVDIQELNLGGNSNVREKFLREYPQIKFAGYLIEKYEVLPNGNAEFLGRLYVRDHDRNFAVDTEVRYGGTYTYKIRTVCQVKAVVHTIQENSACAQAVLATCFMASEGKLFSVNCVERVPPPPPTNLRVTFDFETLVPRITWQFPINPQRDIKRFQIFKRFSIDEPFTLLHEYDFDNSLVRSPVAEVAPAEKITAMNRPRTYYTDTSHAEGEKPIYAIACVDAHGLSSNYSPQLMVERDRYTNRVKRTIISRGNAPKPYPNIYLNNDTFEDAIKTSEYDRIRIIFDPEYYRVVKNDVVPNSGLAGQTGTQIVERDLNLLAIDDNNFRYKFHFINIDNQKDQIVNIRLFNYASAGSIGENSFETSVATLSDNNLSFQYGVE